MLTREEAGSVTLEAAIILPIFIFIFLSIFGLFGMMTARNQVTRALIQANKSISMDPYFEKKLGAGGDIPTMSQLLVDLYEGFIMDVKPNNLSGEAKAKDRFVRFFSGGDESAADEKLKNLGVEGGLGGLTFTLAEGDNVTMTVQYKLKFLFDFVQVGSLNDITQTVESRMWK